MSTLSSTGRDGINRTFEFTITRSPFGGGCTFRVTTIPPSHSGDFFELVVAELDPKTVRVEMANHFNRPEYMAMGIPEALLPIVKKELGMEVESSPTRGAANVYRTPAATKYWERLVYVGGATYDASRDVYLVI